MKKFAVLLLLAAVLTAKLPVSLSAQDFGFGFSDYYDDYDDYDDSGSSAGRGLSVAIGGEVSASMVGFFDGFSEGLDHVRLGDIFSGKLNFSAGMSFADGIINLKLQPTEQPVSIDEAYIRVFFGGLEIEGGLRKLTWGKADSFGPLDVINPLDYSDLTGLSDMMSLKIARPLIHVSYRIDSSKIEGVFVPSFEPLRYAAEGRWVPAQMTRLNQLQELGVKLDKPDTSTLEYAQVGMRFTTTIGPADVGFQWYYGRLTRPAVSVISTIITIPPYYAPTTSIFAYNPYHQIGADWAQVVFGFNARAEVALNITGDLSGDDGAVYNPALLWSLGFDRDLGFGVNLNFQLNESVRFMNDKIGNNPLIVDTEADTDMTSTQVITALSKKFFRDELETRVAFIWEIEAGDFLFMPSFIWTRDAVSAELSFGFFGGKEGGQFGQYKNNSFVKIALTYSF